MINELKCPKCGNPVEQDIRYCESCGADLYLFHQEKYCNFQENHNTYVESTEQSVTFSRLKSFFLPIYGILLYFTLKNEDRPQKAKIVLKAALHGTFFYVAVILVMSAFAFLVLS